MDLLGIFAVILTFAIFLGLTVGAIKFAYDWMLTRSRSEQDADAAANAYNKIDLACQRNVNTRYRYLVNSGGSVIGKIWGVGIVQFPKLGSYLDREDNTDGVHKRRNIKETDKRRLMLAIRYTPQWQWYYNAPVFEWVFGRFRKFEIFLLAPDQINNMRGGDIIITGGWQPMMVGNYFFMVDDEFSVANELLKLHSLSMAETMAAIQETVISAVERGIKADPTHQKEFQLKQDEPKASLAGVTGQI